MSEWDLTHGINEWEKKERVWGGKVILVNVQETAAARKGGHLSNPEFLGACSLVPLQSQHDCYRGTWLPLPKPEVVALPSFFPLVLFIKK